MKIEPRRLVDQVLALDQPCLGAVFCTYTFDPSYFEEHVLRSVLRMASDPEQDAARFHEEARAALRETPVACFIDGRVRQAGRRLPYDLHLVRERTFHPKLSLVLYGTEARLAVGSGNVTRPGFEQNAELFFHRTLYYDEPMDAALLRAVDGFLQACAALANGGGTQLKLVRAALRARISNTRHPAASTARDVSFVHTFDAAGLSWLKDVLPAGAAIQRIGVLSPYFERDDLDAAHEHNGLASVLADLVAMQPGARPVIDLGVPWDDAPLAPPAGATAPPLEAGRGLWAWRTHQDVGGEVIERINYHVIERVTAKRVEVRDAGGLTQRFERELVESAIADRRMWPVPTPTVHAPANILRRLRAEYPFELWLHPTAALAPSGRAARRPLHAKLFLVTTVSHEEVSTYALVGSANASRAAMSRSVAEGGNVEAGVVLRLAGEVRLHDLLPTLVASNLDSVQLEERAAPPSELDLSAWIEEAVHCAGAQTLTVTWANTGPAQLGPWRLEYLDQEIAQGDGPAAAPTVVAGFSLSPISAEVALVSSSKRWTVPIRVANLELLPASAALARLDLRALLALLGRRVGSERLSMLMIQRGPAGISAALDSVFGEGFGPADVFKAWWGMREDLAAASTLASFRFRLYGVSGVTEVWRRMCEVPADQLSPEEVWIYGCELVRELEHVAPASSADRAVCAAMLADVVAAIRGDLKRLAPAGEDRPWLDSVRRFYAGGRPS